MKCGVRMHLCVYVCTVAGNFSCAAVRYKPFTMNSLVRHKIPLRQWPMAVITGIKTSTSSTMLLHSCCGRLISLMLLSAVFRQCTAKADGERKLTAIAARHSRMWRKIWSNALGQLKQREASDGTAASFDRLN